MTSFLALRASVCAYLWCLIPPVFIVFILCYIGRHALTSPLSLSPMKRSLADAPAASGEGRQFETCFDPYIYIFSPERAQFCSRCLLQFDPAFSGSRLVRCSFSYGSRGVLKEYLHWGYHITTI